MKIKKSVLRKIISESLSGSPKKSSAIIINDMSLSKAYKTGYFDGAGEYRPAEKAFGFNARSLKMGVDDPDYLKGFEDASGLDSKKLAVDYKKRKAEEEAERARKDAERAEKNRAEMELFKNRKKSSDLSDSEQARLKKEYEADKGNTARYERVTTPTMVDAMYGRRGSNATSVVLDKKENVTLTFTTRSGRGGSLGS